MRLVKGLVIAMSVALAVGFAILMVGLAQKAMNLGGAEDTPPYRMALDLPEGATIVTVAGAAGLVAVLVEYPDGRRDIHMVDPTNGRLTGVIAAD